MLRKFCRDSDAVKLSLQKLLVCLVNIAYVMALPNENTSERKQNCHRFVSLD